MPSFNSSRNLWGGGSKVKAFTLRDMVLVRLKGVLTPAERQLAKNAEGVNMVKRMRQNLISQGRERLCSQISTITGVEVTGLFTDIETHSGERMRKVDFYPDHADFFHHFSMNNKPVCCLVI
jgi:uncharacterized protein YbcI